MEDCNVSLSKWISAASVTRPSFHPSLSLNLPSERVCVYVCVGGSMGVFACLHACVHERERRRERKRETERASGGLSLFIITSQFVPSSLSLSCCLSIVCAGHYSLSLFLPLSTPYRTPPPPSPRSAGAAWCGGASKNSNKALQTSFLVTASQPPDQHDPSETLFLTSPRTWTSPRCPGASTWATSSATASSTRPSAAWTGRAGSRSPMDPTWVHFFFNRTGQDSNSGPRDSKLCYVHALPLCLRKIACSISA